MTATKTTHTPGPWLVTKHGTPDYAPQFGIYAEGEPRDLAIITGDNSKADADLMAAAPDLLAALEALLDSEGDDNARELAGAAIAKAEGRA
jgi:hypothetical protein